jgi:signal transduction histidine kinase
MVSTTRSNGMPCLEATVPERTRTAGSTTMVPTGPLDGVPGAIAQDARGSATMWRKSPLAIRAPADASARVSWHVRSLMLGAVAVAGALSLIMLASQLHAVLQGSPGVLGIKLNSLIGLGCLCWASWLVSSRSRARRSIGIVLAAIAALLGATTLLEHLAGIDLAIDRLGDPGSLGRMGGNTALLFSCLGAGLALGHASPRAVRTLSDGLVLAAAAIALFALISHLFGSQSQYPLAAHDPMLWPIALVGFALCIATVLQRSDRGLGQLLSNRASGGVHARRLIPVLIVGPIAITRLALLGVEAGAFDIAFAAALSVIASVTILVLVLVGSARVVERLDLVRRGNEAQIRQMVQDLSRHSEELHRTNRELESFSYSVSHDLRAPIRHISGFAELLAMHARERLDAKGQKYLETIMASARNAGRLIDELLEFSRIGRAALNTRDLELREVVQDSWNQLTMDRRGRDIRLEVGELPAVHADPTLIGVVVSNLLENAVKYTAPRERAVVEVAARRDGDEVIVDVRDNGVGFDMKYVDKLFGVFQRLHGEEFAGTGIGLATVKRIVERHGGRVWAEGELDRGATFHFSLPGAKERS